MLEGLYAAAAGMQAQQTQLNAVANDIANGDTPGYQSTVVGFSDLLFTSGGYSGADPAPTGTGATANVLGHSQAQGSITPTGEPLDVAIGGNGYIEVRQANGTTGLTRNGTLELNADGQLTTNLGMPLQPPITVPLGTDPSHVHIDSGGAVSVGGRKLGTINLVTVPAPNQLLADGGGVFTATAASGAITRASTSTLQQGSLEQSNVDLNQAMTTMTTAEQGYDLDSKAISFEQQMGQIASTIKQ
ncbi:MAG: flagellar hook-basal body protein [Solirubrobacteraceae bacterium]